MTEDIRPLRTIVEMVQESLAKGNKALIRIAGDPGGSGWHNVDEFGFVDGTDEFVLTAHLSNIAEGQRLIFPAINFVAARIVEE